VPRCRQMFFHDRRSTAHSCGNLLFFSYSRFAIARRCKVNRVSGVETALTRSLLSPIQDMRSHGVAKLICSRSSHRLLDAGDRTAPQLDRELGCKPRPFRTALIRILEKAFLRSLMVVV
jgi:hypothetical protein